MRIKRQRKRRRGQELVEKIFVLQVMEVDCSFFCMFLFPFSLFSVLFPIDAKRGNETDGGLMGGTMWKKLERFPLSAGSFLPSFVSLEG